LHFVLSLSISLSVLLQHETPDQVKKLNKYDWEFHQNKNPS
jgi:hypothetical protein